MKVDIYITHPEDFIRGGYNLRYAFTALGQTENGEDGVDGWIFVQTVEIDETLIDHTAVLAAAESQLDGAESEIRARFQVEMDRIEKARGELLALPGVAE